MEGAVGLEVTPRLLKCDIVGDHLHYVCAAFDVLDYGHGLDLAWKGNGWDVLPFIVADSPVMPSRESDVLIGWVFTLFGFFAPQGSLMAPTRHEYGLHIRSWRACRTTGPTIPVGQQQGLTPKGAEPGSGAYLPLKV